MPIICHRGPLIHAFPTLIHASAGNPIHSHLKSRAWLSSCMYKHASELHPILVGFSGANGKVSMTSNTRIERQRRRFFFLSARRRLCNAACRMEYVGTGSRTLSICFRYVSKTLIEEAGEVDEYRASGLVSCQSRLLVSIGLDTCHTEVNPDNFISK